MELNKTFKDGLWSKEINVRDFVSNNITPYEGDASFLQGPTERTKAVWNHCLKALEEERNNNGIRALDYTTVSTITSHPAGYIDKENELIVGLQTDQVLKRAIKPFGGINVVMKACRENGVEVDDRVKDIFTHYRKTHNDGVFDVYTEEIRSFRSLGFLTGLPDNYARGRIIGDYRRLALYGLDRLIEAKKEDLHNLTGPMTETGRGKGSPPHPSRFRRATLPPAGGLRTLRRRTLCTRRPCPGNTGRSVWGLFDPPGQQAGGVHPAAPGPVEASFQ